MFRRKTILTTLFSLLILCALFSLVYSQTNPLEEGIRQFQAENYEEALESLKIAKAQNPESALVAYFLGLTLRQMGEIRASIEEFKRAVTLQPPVIEAYFDLIELLLTLDNLKEAQFWLAKAEGEKVRPAQVSFLKGLLHLREGKIDKAIIAFEEAKKLDPTLEQAANLQIALAQIKERKFKTALQTLKIVTSIDPKSELAEFAKEYERALERLIKEHKFLKIGLSLNYQYDDNAVGADGTIVKRAHDTINSGSLRLEIQPLIEPPWYFNFQSHLSTSYYKRFDNLNTKSITFVGIPGFHLPKGMFSIPTSYTRNWLDEKEYSENYSLKPSLNLILMENHLSQFYTGYGKTRMIRKYPWQREEEESRTSTHYNFGLGYIYSFAEGRGMVNLRYEHQINEAKGKNWKNKGDKLSGTVLIPLHKKLSLSFFGDYSTLRFNYVHTVFGKKRKDTQMTGGFLLRWILYRGLSINCQGVYIRNKSNIKVYDYDKKPFSIGIDYEF
ncbi:MAG: tetratricopeptide repeat protein [Caldimicrobium sp.]|nr:tetratricopeptide repeat protein [Caldimicrobium sp.]